MLRSSSMMSALGGIALVLLNGCGRPLAAPAEAGPPTIAVAARDSTGSGSQPADLPDLAAPTPSPLAAPSSPPARPRPAATPAAPPGVAIAPTARGKRIGPLTFISQTLNNCGPASVAEVLDFYGVHRTQAQVAAVLRPNLPQYGMSLYGVPFYAQSVGMQATLGSGGNDQLIKSLISNGFPVIVADLVSTQERIRHFRPIDGYDDQQGYFIGSDPYLGPNHRIPYSEFDQLWKISQEQFVAIYPAKNKDLVQAVIAQHWDRSAAYQKQLALAQQRAAQLPHLGWTWMGLADAQIETGDLAGATQSLRKASELGLQVEAHWLQLEIGSRPPNPGP
ncbi:MAG: C39 family peptidase [Chloroflexota bacterium]|nr:C39 family peptidase [Chloroflexota bacterium]